MHVVALGRACQGADDMRRRPRLGVPATEIDQGFAPDRCSSTDSHEKCAEILLRKSFQAFRVSTHAREPSSVVLDQRTDREAVE